MTISLSSKFKKLKELNIDLVTWYSKYEEKYRKKLET